MNRSRGISPLLWMGLLAMLFLGLRACGGPAVVDADGQPVDLGAVAPGEPGADFAAPPQTRRIALENGMQIHEGHVADALRAAGQHEQWSAFSWLFNDVTVTTVAPGLDRRHHFANAYLVGYVPYEKVDAWVPLYALSRSKTYQFDHDQYPGAPELWQTSREAFFYPNGDCEDHAIALADWLIGLGHDARVVIGKVKGEGHAWVVIHDGARTYLLEATDKRPGQALPLAMNHPEYQPEAMFNRETYWVNAGSVLTTDYRGAQWQVRSRFRRG
ncbi:hypothetical protein [Arenimonas sp. MALMAid1274]|uniref:hypothetical protein n=1 Tax=Arenimonas sp. MALMAid1274 TaxID=3411630 RepID=UPI003BA01368